MTHYAYSIIVINCCQIQSSSKKISLYSMGTNTETQSNTFHTHRQIRDTHTHLQTHSCKWGFFIKFLPSENTEVEEAEWVGETEKTENTSRKKKKGFLIQQSKPIRNSQKLKQHAMGLLEWSSDPLCIEYSFLCILLMKLLHL